jgi:hypothetical protein
VGLVFSSAFVYSTYSDNNISFSYPNGYMVKDFNNNSPDQGFITLSFGNLYLGVIENSSNSSDNNFTLCTISEPPVLIYSLGGENESYAKIQILGNDSSLEGCVKSIKSSLDEGNLTIYNETELTINGFNTYEIIYEDPFNGRSIIVIYEDPSNTKFYAIQGIYQGYEDQMKHIIESFKITS